MQTAQRASRRSRPRRTTSGRAHRRVYVGSAVTPQASSRVFLSQTTQQMASRPLLDWLGGALMMGGIVAWGALIALLGS
jgi:hypothetical protein